MRETIICHGSDILFGNPARITIPACPTLSLRDVKKALRCANSEEPKNEESTNNLQKSPTTPETSAQLPPLAADLEGLAVSLGVLAGSVSPEQWEFLKLFRSNLRAAAERVASLENSLEIPHEQA